MPTLDFTIQGQKLSVIQPNFTIIANSVNYLEANFDWINEEEWKDLFIYGQFSWNNLNYFIDFQEKGNHFFIPWEVIKTPGFTVSVFGTKTEIDSADQEYKIIRQITTNVLPFKVEQSGNLQGNFGDENSNELDVWTTAKLALTTSEEAIKKVNETKLETDKILTEFQENLEKINAAAALKEDFESYKEQIKNKFLDIENSLKELTTNYTNEIENAISKLKQKELTEINTKVENLQKQDIEFQNDIEDLSRKIAANLNSITSITQSISDINETLSDLNEYVNSNDNVVRNIEENLTNINTQLDSLQEQINTNINDISLLFVRLKEIEEQANRKIKKEDTDFIKYVNLNLITEYNDGKIDLGTGEINEDNLYFYSNYIDVDNTPYFCTNSNNFDVFCYTKRIEINEESGEKIISYLLVSSFSVIDTNYFKIEQGIDTIRISAEKMIGLFILEKGLDFKEDYSYYEFDSELTSTIQNIIDKSIGAILNAEY